MNRAEKMLSVLRDGDWHSRREIFERVGFMLTNNAASELRAAGHHVDHDVVAAGGERIDVYRLAGRDFDGKEALLGCAGMAHREGPNATRPAVSLPRRAAVSSPSSAAAPNTELAGAETGLGRTSPRGTKTSGWAPAAPASSAIQLRLVL